MALPKIKSPIYELTLHSTKQSYKYRPFLVKEQKILLMALESQDPKEMLRAIKQIITNCSVDEIDVDNNKNLIIKSNVRFGIFLPTSSW